MVRIYADFVFFCPPGIGHIRRCQKQNCVIWSIFPCLGAKKPSPWQGEGLGEGGRQDVDVHSCAWQYCRSASRCAERHVTNARSNRPVDPPSSQPLPTGEKALTTVLEG